MTLEGTPDIVWPSGVAGLEFLDEAETANRYAAELHRRGVDAVVVLLHEGGAQTGPAAILELDRHSGEVTQVAANNRIITQTVMKAPDISELIARYNTLAAPLRDRVIGNLAADAGRAQDDSGESVMGNLIADAQLAATDDAGTGQAVAAFMNPGGVRAELAAGEITYGEAFTVQPFGNSLVTMTLTGAQILEMLKQQWCGQSSPRILLPSQGVTYSWSAAVATAITGQPCEGAANPVSDLQINGVAVDPAASYRITVNSFLADGGDLFTVLRSGTDRLGGAVDTDALEAYLAPSLSGAPLVPPATDRITRLP